MRFTFILSIIFSIFAGSLAAEGLIPERRLALIRDVDLPGGDIRSIFDTTLDACQNACISDEDCVAFTYNTRSRACFPKAELGEETVYDGAFSGRVLTAGPDAEALAENRVAELGFLKEADLDRAVDVAAHLHDRHVTNNFTVGAFLTSAVEARSNGNIVQAYRFTGAATVLSDAPDHWTEYARLALGIETDRSNEQRQFRERALSAAINAYLRAPTEPLQHNALVVMAEAFEALGRGRDMIPALRLAQAKQIRSDTQEMLDDAVSKYGFRIVDSVAENDNAQPRICAEFSEPLVQAGVDYAPFVQVETAGLTVEPLDRRLCLAGVQHGSRYQVMFREGLPAASGETLIKDTEITLYVRDRSPAVRFPGRAYVLPATGEVNIPVETVNASELDLVLRQVSERSVLRAIEGGYFGRPLSPWQAREFGETVATTVWEGVGEVGSELNADVVTRLPLTEVVGALDPGIYALDASIPDSDPYDTPTATQWFVVSDLGLATMEGVDGLHVFTRGLNDAAPEAGVTLTLLSQSNAVLDQIETDSKGYANFEPGLMNGTGGATPALVLAKLGDDLTFLSLDEPEFDLSDRGVEGRDPAGPVDVFLTTDRGAYRAGEVINATVLARDGKAEAIEGLPLIAVLTRPDGVEYSRALSNDGVAGGHVFDFQTSGSVPRGAWRLTIHVDPDAPAVAATTVLIEDFLPERLDFELSLPDGPILPTDRPILTVDADYLFGAPAGDLQTNGHVQLRGVRTLADYPGYRFGRHDETLGAGIWYFPGNLRTDADGLAEIPLELPELEPNFVPLQLEAIATVSEGSGRPVERAVTHPVSPLTPVLGIKPKFDGTLAENTEAAFDLIALGPDLEPAAMDIRWTINRVERRYQWYSYDGYWDWEPVVTRTQVAQGEASFDGQPVTVTAPVEWGQYEIRVERIGGAYLAASEDFSAGWYGGADASSTPDLLELSLDAERYDPGATAQLRVVPRYPGKGLITVMSNKLIEMRPVDLVAGENLFDLTVTDEWGTGAYVSVTAIKPTEVDAGRNPARSLGNAHAAVDPGAHRLAVSIEAPEESEPRGPMPVAVKVDGVAAGEAAYVTLAAVDVGILNLTGFDSPDPSAHYFGQRKLGMGLRDVYGRLIDGMNGGIGNVRSGGDFLAEAGLEAPPPTEELVAFFSGPLEVGADGYARASFDMPPFNGTVRLMAVAWSATAVGETEAEVLVRDPIVLTASLPRFMAPGDSAQLLMEIVHASGPAGRVSVDLETDGVLFGSALLGADLAEGGKATLRVPFTAGDTGLAEIAVTLTTPDDKTLRKVLKLPIAVNDPIVTHASRFDLAAGGTFTLSSDVFAGYRTGTASATLAAGPIARLDAPGLLLSLDRYPYGCTEQTTSRAMPLLYMSSVAEAMGIDERDGLNDRITAAIEQVLTRQSSNGAFGLWRVGSGDFWLDAYVTDFLSRARAQGFDVPQIAFANALDNLRNRVNYAPNFDEGGEDIAYALYVLAREGAASIGDLRYYADVKMGAFGTPLAVAQLGAALAAYGDPTRADRLFTHAAAMLADEGGKEPQIWRADYGTRLRDRAGVLTLALEAGSTALDLEALADSVAPIEPVRHLSTQEQVWSLLATHALLDTDQLGNLTVNGAAVNGPLVRIVEDDTAFAPMEIVNVGDGSETLTLTTFGVPEVPEPAGGNGYAITRRYFDMEGNPVELETVEQGTRLVTVLTVQPHGETAARLMVNDPLPAGFEIDNPNLMRGSDIRALDWLDLTSSVENSEFRQDRFLAAIDWRSDEPVRLGYIVRAVSPGTFHHPAPSVEDMYRPEFRAHGDTGQVTVVE